jgi:maltooligosyltrehalose synthase
MTSVLTSGNEAGEATVLGAEAVVDAVLQEVESRLAQVRLPEATYRLQVNHAFTFRDVQQVVPYLADLGISDCYLSPYMKARAGTTHGYDIVDHNHLNPEIGSEADFESLVGELKSHEMGQIVDVVPNHMGVDTRQNAWWLDVLENGPGSPYASFFDIDWAPIKPDLANKVLLPVLGDQYGKVLEDQQLVLAFEEGAFVVHYCERTLPVEPRSWELILKHRVEELQQRLGTENPHMLEYFSILTAIGHLPPPTETDPQKVEERRREKEVLKRRISDLCNASPEVRSFIDENRMRIVSPLRKSQPCSPRADSRLISVKRTAPVQRSSRSRRAVCESTEILRSRSLYIRTASCVGPSCNTRPRSIKMLRGQSWRMAPIWWLTKSTVRSWLDRLSMRERHFF